MLLIFMLLKKRTCGISLRIVDYVCLHGIRKFFLTLEYLTCCKCKYTLLTLLILCPYPGLPCLFYVGLDADS